MKRCLIVTGDDFGFSKERNKGILEAFNNSAVKSVSLLLNCTGTGDGVLLSKDNKNLCTGLHLNLTEGSCLNKSKYLTLTNSNGEFWGRFGLRKLLDAGKIDQLEIKTEIKCQIEEFNKVMGSYPVYVDGHQHIHVHPAVAKIFASTLQEYGIQVTRFPIEVSMDKKQWVSQALMDFFHLIIKESEDCKSVFDSHGVRYSDAFVGLSTMGADMTIARLQSIILEGFQHAEKSFDPSNSFVSCELMSHPGYATGEFSGGFNGRSDDFGCSKDREYEIGILSSKEMANFYKENAIELVSHRQLLSL